MKQPHKHCNVIIAWANGEEIQREDGDGWFDWKMTFGITPNFDLGNWRIKPKTVKREGWVNLAKGRDDGWAAHVTHAYLTKDEADLCASTNRIACIRIEWEEEV